MKQYFGCIYHSLALVHHIIAIRASAKIDYSQSTDLRIIEMEHFASRYFTCWNMIIQTSFLVLAVITDLMPFMPKGFRNCEKNLLTLKGYVFTSFMFPCTPFVSGMFWGLYSINREWVMPAAADAVLPKWLNHSIHTLILVPIFVELFIANHRLPSFKTAFVGLNVLVFIYEIMFFFTYYQSGRWLYGIFYVLTWQERIVFMMLNYLTVVIFLKMGIFLQCFKGKGWGKLGICNLDGWSLKKLTKEL